MIVALCSDPFLRAAVQQAAHSEEDAFVEERLVARALGHGFPRAVIYVPDEAHRLVRRLPLLDDTVRTIALSQAQLRGWEADRRTREVPPPRVASMAGRLAVVLDRRGEPASWVDRALADLSRASGARLPKPLRALGRRVMEFPAHYADLYGLSEVTGMSRGALKARFRRRGLASPYAYVRWFRVLAAAHLLADREVTTLAAAHRLGFTTGGNFCRTVKSVSGRNSSELRDAGGWNRLLVTFALRHLTPSALAAWETLDGLFGQQAA